MTEEEITRVLADMGQPAFRGKQVFTWLHRGVRSFDEMSNLSKPLRQQLAQAYTISVPTVARKQESRLDGTIKYLWELPDGNCIETVLMQYHHGNTVCISSQVGCRMGCAFCASTVAGKVRDLTAGEMLDQVLFTQLDSDREISNIVLMGIGEPLDNRDNVLRFLRLVNHPDGLNIGMRHISLATCGAGHRRPGGGGPAADAVGVPPRAGQRDPVPDHAGEPGLGCGGAVCRLPPVFPSDRAAHIL